MSRIDAHVHVTGDHPQIIGLLKELDVKLLNICVAHQASTWRQRAADYARLTAAHPQHFAWCTTFDPPDFRRADYADRVIAGLDEDLQRGACACKVWKNIGMEIRDPDGAFIQVDHRVLRPVFDYLEKIACPVILHMGEPLACWRPLTEIGPHTGYYRNHPEWHMYGRDGVPSHADIIAARDRLLDRHPKLAFIGAHLGSLEYDVDEVARRLQQFGNFAVDTSARLFDLAFQDRTKVRNFFAAFPDRVLFGTDLVARTPASELDEADRDALANRLRQAYDLAQTYYAKNEDIPGPGRTVRGIGLSANILDQLYSGNVARWIPDAV